MKNLSCQQYLIWVVYRWWRL